MKAAPLKVVLAVATAAMLAACSETKLVVHAAKQLSAPAEGAKGGPYKVGKPYQIKGVWYYPAEDYSYDETGIASWYGPDFHGKFTANGEVYDQNALSAAHRTLPMPTFVRVTNLENGRSLVVRVNDRGPFAHSRIIDLSRRSAQLLGIEQKGTAKVRVEVMAEESRALASRLRGSQPSPDEPQVAAAPRETVTAETLPAPGSKEAPRPVVTASNQTASRAFTSVPEPVLDAQEVKVVPVKATQMYIQAGAFSRYDYANRLSAQLSPIGKTTISQAKASGGDIYRVRLGPVSSVEEADKLLDKIVDSGFPDARLVVD